MTKKKLEPLNLNPKPKLAMQTRLQVHDVSVDVDDSPNLRGAPWTESTQNIGAS